MIDKKNILKDKPDYEEYTKNEVKLTIGEMKDLGLLSCSGCCSRNSSDRNKCSGCNKIKKCCK